MVTYISGDISSISEIPEENKWLFLLHLHVFSHTGHWLEFEWRIIFIYRSKWATFIQSFYSFDWSIVSCFCPDGEDFIHFESESLQIMFTANSVWLKEIFIVPFSCETRPSSSGGSPQLVFFYDKQGILQTYSNTDHQGIGYM